MPCRSQQRWAAIAEKEVMEQMRQLENLSGKGQHWRTPYNECIFQTQKWSDWSFFSIVSSGGCWCRGTRGDSGWGIQLSEDIYAKSALKYHCFGCGCNDKTLRGRENGESIHASSASIGDDYTEPLWFSCPCNEKINGELLFSFHICILPADSMRGRWLSR